MSCVLSIIGEDFDPDEFVKRSGVVPYKIVYKGNRRHGLPHAPIMQYSFVSLIASDAEMDDVKTQIEETINYLKAEFSKLQHIKDTLGVQDANLHFGANYEYKFCNSFYFPTELIALAASLGLSIETSVYEANEDDEELELV